MFKSLDINILFLSIFLEKPQTHDLLRQIASINNKWWEIGIELQLSHDFLEGLQQKPYTTMIKLHHVISEWMKNAQSVTWETVINAIEGPIVNDKNKADEIREYLANQRHT